jgi:mono/diheme cytochrome c family protein
MNQSGNSGAGTATGRRVFLILLFATVAGGGIVTLLVLRADRMRRLQQAAENPSAPAEDPLALGERLYRQNCAACHGDQGGGDGPAAKFLQPKPRNFGEDKFRLVSTVNRVPSDEDLLFVLEHGMPGSAMFPFAHLSETERQALVRHVRQLTRTAFSERMRREAKNSGDELDPAEMAEILDRATKPGEALTPPADWPDSTAASVARGREAYRKVCAPCHGTTGKGDGVQDQRNDDGLPTRPRDLTRGIFKSGRDAHRLFTRIRLGLPGSPMPSLSEDAMPSASVIDLVHYVLSLSAPSLQARAEHKRTLLSARRVEGTLADDIADKEWEAAKAVPIAVSPLWWRNYDEPDLTVAALHDGQTLAVRLSWRDGTRNDSAVRPQDFEDMAALQLFKGEFEPFLGMGTADRPVDVWLWNPSIQAKPSDFADVDTAYPHMSVDLYPFEKPSDGPRRHAPVDQPPDFVTARKAGNLRADPAHGFTASSLQAGGFGSSTMRPRLSQLVASRGVYQDGRWTVVFRRPLGVPAESGLSLAPGDKLSIAFALWDGAARDRNGQKLVSIWHDLKVEEP